MKINDFVPDSKLFQAFGSSDKETVVEEKDFSFGNLLNEKLNDVNNKQILSDKSTDSFIKGEGVDVHKVMLDGEEAKLSLELAVQMRNKLVEAYQELNRMQL